MTEKNYHIHAEVPERYELHQQVEQALDGKEAGRHLWALAPTPGGAVLRVHTEREVDLTLPWPELPGGIVETTQAGQTFQFVLDVNPRKKLAPTVMGERQRGKRVGITNPDEIRQWLRRRGPECGFDLEDAAVDVLPGLRIRRRGQTMHFTRAMVTGTLRITDPAAFHDFRAAGIGGGKAFGMGLLILLPNS
ncbi:MAG: type I-E CRISPR-associated protein Cas6/Cse3/CasE [Pseudomonas sp.]